MSTMSTYISSHLPWHHRKCHWVPHEAAIATETIAALLSIADHHDPKHLNIPISCGLKNGKVQISEDVKSVWCWNMISYQSYIWYACASWTFPKWFLVDYPTCSTGFLIGPFFSNEASATNSLSWMSDVHCARDVFCRDAFTMLNGRQTWNCRCAFHVWIGPKKTSENKTQKKQQIDGIIQIPKS